MQNSELCQVIKTIILSTNNSFPKVLAEDYDEVVDTIQNYCKGMSYVSDKNKEFFLDKFNHIDLIRFSKDDPDLKSIYVPEENDCIDFTFSSKINNNNYTGIVISDKNIKNRNYNLMRQLTHYVIETDYEDGKFIYKNDLFKDSNNRLYEGISEKITQDAWNYIYPKVMSPGEREERYFSEVQIATVLMDIMGKSRFIEILLDNPTEIINKLKSVSYGQSNLFDYLERQLEPLVPLKGRHEKEMSYFDALDSIEALSDCSKQLVLERKRVNK